MKSKVSVIYVPDELREVYLEPHMKSGHGVFKHHWVNNVFHTGPGLKIQEHYQQKKEVEFLCDVEDTMEIILSLDSFIITTPPGVSIRIGDDDSFFLSRNIATIYENVPENVPIAAGRMPVMWKYKSALSREDIVLNAGYTLRGIAYSEMGQKAHAWILDDKQERVAMIDTEVEWYLL